MVSVYVRCTGSVHPLVSRQAELGLGATHREMILDYLKFARYKRGQCLRGVESAFSDLADSRLLEETFTSESIEV